MFQLGHNTLTERTERFMFHFSGVFDQGMFSSRSARKLLYLGAISTAGYTIIRSPAPVKYRQDKGIKASQLCNCFE